MEWSSPFVYFVSLWWSFFIFAFCIYLFIYSISAWKDFAKWY